MHGMDAELAKARPEAWALAPDVAFRINSTPGEYLSPVVIDLRLVGLEADADRLGGRGVVDYLAGLAGVARPTWRASGSGCMTTRSRPDSPETERMRGSGPYVLVSQQVV